MILLTLPTNASAGAEIRLSDDRQGVLVPVETFRAWQAELQELDALRGYKARIDTTLAKLENQVMALEVALEQERRATDATVGSLQLSIEKYKRRAKSPGLGVGFGWSSADEWAAIVGLVWKLDGLVP